MIFKMIFTGTSIINYYLYTFRNELKNRIKKSGHRTYPYLIKPCLIKSVVSDMNI
jgi:hypothetical protein